MEGALVMERESPVSYRTLRQQHRWSIRAFVASCLLLAGLAAWLLPPAYRASTTVMVTEDPIQSEWALLRDESRQVNFEEHIRSRRVLEPALRRAGLFPPPAHELKWWTWIGAPSEQDVPNALRRTVQQLQAWWTWISIPSEQDTPTVLLRVLKKFQSKLEVERIRHSAITRITVTARDPVSAANTANAVVQAWFEVRREQATAQPLQLVATIDQELQALHGELETLNGVHQRYSLIDASVAELIKETARVEGQLSAARSRYAETNPLVMQLRQERDTLAALMDEQTASRRRILEDAVNQQPQTAWLLTAAEPEPGTIETAVAQGQHRYQELLQQRVQAQQVLALWQNSTGASGNLSVLDEAVPPRRTSRAARLALALLAAALLSVLGAALLPVLFHLWDTRAHAAHRLLSDRLFGLVDAPAPTNGSHEHGRTV